jgi:DNA-binding CsgD family transcriptional regulator
MNQTVLLGKTIEKLYEAALNSARWRDALTAIEQFTGCTGAVVDLIPLHPSTRPVTFSGSFSNEDCAEYARDYQAICPRIAYAVAHPEVATHFDRLILTETEMDRDPVYEWFGRHGLRYYIAGHAGRTQFYQAFASLQRSRKQGHADADDIARFELIRPHLAQALSIADTLGTLATHQTFSNALLDAMPQAVFGLADDGAVLLINEAAERLLGRGTCLRISGRRLITADCTQQSEFDQVLASVTTDDAQAAAGRLLIRRVDGGQPYATRMSRIAIAETEILMRPTVLVVITDPESGSDIDAQSLRELFGLTPCETRVAAALLQGHSLQSAAHCQGSSIETVRCHLKSVFRKVGVSRQQDLIRILSDLEWSTISQPAA